MWKVPPYVFRWRHSYEYIYTSHCNSFVKFARGRALCLLVLMCIFRPVAVRGLPV